MGDIAPVFQRVAIIGLGLIGGSLASAIKKHKLAAMVVGADQSQSDLAYDLKNQVIDEAAASIAEAVNNADLVVIAVPVRATEAVLREVKPALEAQALLMVS
jgi:3-phosphoshikimate 1-carboxyvinyltransferase